VDTLLYNIISITHYFLYSGHYYYNQGQIRWGAKGAIAPAPQLQGGPRDEMYLFQIKYSFEKFRD